MTILERAAFWFLRQSGYELRDVWDSWRLVLANKDPGDQHSLVRHINRHLMSEQLMEQCRVRRVDLAVDVGACHGDFVANLRRSGFGGRVISVEPNPDLHDKLRKRFDSDPDWRLYDVAVGSGGETVELSISSDISFSSTLSFAPEARRIFGDLVSESRVVRVPRRLLGEVIAEDEGRSGMRYQSIFLKSDTQGLDRVVVDSMAAHLDLVTMLMVEVPAIAIYEGLGSMHEHLKYYETKGFRIAGCYPVSWTAQGEVVEFDCIYLRDISYAKP